MTSLFKLLFIVALCAVLQTCDGLTIRKARIDLTKCTQSSSIAGARTGDLQGFLSVIENVARKNGMDCSPYKETDKYFGGGMGSFNLVTFVRGDRLVEVELREFGPWGKTERFEKLEVDINEMLARECQEQSFALRKAN